MSAQNHRALVNAAAVLVNLADALTFDPTKYMDITTMGILRDWRRLVSETRLEDHKSVMKAVELIEKGRLVAGPDVLEIRFASYYVQPAAEILLSEARNIERSIG